MSVESIIVYLPVLVLILYSILSKRTVEPIILAVLTAYCIKYGLSFLEHFLDGIYKTLANETIIFLIIMLTLFGGLIELIRYSKGILGMIQFLRKRIHSQKTALLSTWLMGIALFMDDYLNSLLVGTTMRSITDKFAIPRIQVSIISITTSVPLSIMVPVSTWAVFIFGVLKTTGLDTSPGQIMTHMKIMPYMIYPMISILGTALMVFGLSPKVFKLKKAYDDFKVQNDQEVTIIGNPYNFVIPIACLIAITVLTLNITYGLVTALLVTLVWLVFSKQVKFKDGIDVVLSGMSTMTSPLIFIIFAFTFGEILTELGFSNAVLDLISPIIAQENLLVFSFLLVAGIVFAGVDVWASIPLILPVLLPLAQVHDVHAFMVIGAILSGISFGTQICFISESNILVSGTLGLKPVNQVIALMPYALTYGALTSLIFLYLGYTL